MPHQILKGGGGGTGGDHKNVTGDQVNFIVTSTTPPPSLPDDNKGSFFEREEECVHKEGELYVPYVLYWSQWRELLPCKMFKMSPSTAPLVGGGVRYIFMPESSLWYGSLSMCL